MGEAERLGEGTACMLNRAGVGVDHALAFDRLEQPLERDLMRPHADGWRGARHQHLRIAGANEIRQLAGRSAGAPSTATGKIAEAGVLGQDGQESVDCIGRQAIANDNAIEFARVEAPGALLDAERAHHAHALADGDAQGGMMAAAADQQNGGVVERIAGGKLGHDVAFLAERFGASDHGGMERAKPKPRGDAGEQLLNRRVVGNRHGVGQGWGVVNPKPHDHGEKGGSVGSPAGQCGYLVGIAGRFEHDGGGLDLGDGGGGAGPGGFEDRKGAGVDQGLGQPAVGLLGNDQDRTLQGHGRTEHPTAEA